MSHKSLISGTVYNISGGKSLISGTVYNISGGKTLVGGTEYNINFKPPVPPSYAMLYSDGDMIFQSGNIADNSKTLINEYTEFINNEYTNYTNVLWYTKKNTIVNVSFKDEISPKSMAYWFYNAINIKYIKRLNFMLKQGFWSLAFEPVQMP